MVKQDPTMHILTYSIPGEVAAWEEPQSKLRNFTGLRFWFYKTRFWFFHSQNQNETLTFKCCRLKLMVSLLPEEGEKVRINLVLKENLRFYSWFMKLNSTTTVFILELKEKNVKQYSQFFKSLNFLLFRQKTKMPKSGMVF